MYSYDRRDTIVVVGFEGNSSGMLARALAGYPTVVATAVLPVIYDLCFDRLLPTLQAVEHTVLVCFGRSDTPVLRLEGMTRNRNGEAADGLGQVRPGVIVPGGPAAIPTGLPLRTLSGRLDVEGVPYITSMDAEGYVCNNLFYHVMLRHPRRVTVRGFVHVPDDVRADDVATLLGLV